MSFSLLPSEIISHIVGYLPTASCLRNLSLTCRFLYHVISAENYRIFRAFVKARFPDVDTPPLWRDAARALTSRSRALDRNAFIAQYFMPPRNPKRIGEPKSYRRDRPSIDYRPAVDSYETWYGGGWFDRKEVLAWGAGSELIMRITDFAQISQNRIDGDEKGKARHSAATWVVYNEQPQVNSWDDICGVHLLVPEQTTKYSDDEDVIVCRRNGSMARLHISPEDGSFSIDKTYDAAGDRLESTELSTGPGRVLAATLGSRFIAFYEADAEGETVHPFATLDLNRYSLSKKACSKLLSDEQVSVSSGEENNKISIFALTPDDVVNVRDIEHSSVNNHFNRKTRITAFEPLSTTSGASGTPGQLFLTGWEDSSVRLHDQRSPQPHVASFVDTVDQCPTYCIRPMGHERFITGAGSNALVKMFDMRMPGKYNYLDAGTPAIQTYRHQSPRKGPTGGIPAGILESISYPRKDISIFLSDRNDRNDARPYPRSRHRYRGPVYTMTQPSPSSSSLYIGVEGGLISFGITSTDDLMGRHAEWYLQNANLESTDPDSSVEFSPLALVRYERPKSADSRGYLNLTDQIYPVHSFRDPEKHESDHANCVPGLDCRWSYLRGRGHRTR